jgi:hypothetical protein
VRHLLGAGRDGEAATLAPRAAREAEAVAAFGLAAEMYAVALRDPGEARAELQAARATALDRAARYREAAGAWRELAGAGDAMLATLREARSLMAADLYEDGLDRLDAAMRAAGEAPLHRKRARRLLAGVSFLLGPRKRPASPPHQNSSIPELSKYRARASQDMELGKVIAFYDPLAGLALMMRARRGLLSAGGGEPLALCDYHLSHLAQYGRRWRGRAPLAERYRDAAEQAVRGAEVQSAELRGARRLYDGLDALRAGAHGRARWRR